MAIVASLPILAISLATLSAAGANPPAPVSTERPKASSAEHPPDCAGPDRWPAGSAFAKLKNEGLISSDDVDFAKVRSDLLASDKIGSNLWRQVFRITFPVKSGPPVEAIAVSDASREECSMSDVTVFVVGKVL